jgi:hypothetical protein
MQGINNWMNIVAVWYKQDSCYCPVNGAEFWGLFFTGAYLPQKLELSPPLDREGMPVRKYVPSFLTKFNPIWFKYAQHEP